MPNTPSTIRRSLAATALALLSGCANLPAAGPTTSAIEDAAALPANNPYVLVDIDNRVAVEAGASAQAGAGRLSGPLPRGRALGLLGEGDLLKVTMWQPNPTGTTLLDHPELDLNIRVGTDGTVSVPYLGRVRAAGATPAQLEQRIASGMKGISQDTQASVLVLEDMTNAVVVQGDVAKPGRFPVSAGAHGLLDVLALAGGPKTPNQQAVVRVTRGGSTETRTLTSIIGNREMDLPLFPGDRVLVVPRGQYFYAFGAVQHVGEQAYDADDITLGRMLARASGLDDQRANPGGVYIYRKQDPEITRKVMQGPGKVGQDLGQVIYRLNLRDPNGFFIAQSFHLKPEDLVYVSNSPFAEMAKVLQLITGLSNIAAIPRNFGVP